MSFGLTMANSSTTLSRSINPNVRSADTSGALNVAAPPRIKTRVPALAPIFSAFLSRDLHEEYDSTGETNALYHMWRADAFG